MASPRRCCWLEPVRCHCCCCWHRCQCQPRGRGLLRRTGFETLCQPPHTLDERHCSKHTSNGAHDSLICLSGVEFGLLKQNTRLRDAPGAFTPCAPALSNSWRRNAQSAQHCQRVAASACTSCTGLTTCHSLAVSCTSLRHSLPCLAGCQHAADGCGCKAGGRQTAPTRSGYFHAIRCRLTESRCLVRRPTGSVNGARFIPLL